MDFFPVDFRQRCRGTVRASQIADQVADVLAETDWIRSTRARITESVLMQDSETTTAMLRALKKWGSRFPWMIRNRLFVAQLPQPLSDRYTENRQVVHSRHQPQQR